MQLILIMVMLPANADKAGRHASSGSSVIVPLVTVNCENLVRKLS